MDNINLKNMHLAYQAVYNQELREEFEEINEDFLGVDYLTEESLEDISEEVIYEMLDEGFELDDIESIFEEFILEAITNTAYNRAVYGTDTAPKAPGRIDKIKGAFKDVLGRVRGAVVQSQGKARESAIQASERASARGAAIKGAVGGLKNKLKDKIGKVVSAAKAGATAVKKEFTGEAEREANARMLNRKAQRSAKDIARSRSTVNPFEPKALPPGRTTKSGKPFNVGQYQMRSGMQNRKLKQRLGEDVDLYDVILSHLLDEGFADTLEGAEAIMVNMSEDWKESIFEGRVNLFMPRSATHQRRQGRPSPAMQAMNKSKELQTTEPGSDRQKKQTRAFRRIAGAGTDALRAKEDRVRKGLE